MLKKPFNIFEPRYVEMLHLSIEKNIPVAPCFGLIREEEMSIGISHDSLHFVKTTCGAGIPQILQEREGSHGSEYLILLDPVGKYEIDHLMDTARPFNIAKARQIIEFESVLPENFLTLQRLELELRKWAKQYFQDTKQYEDLIHELSDPVLLVATFTEFVVESPTLKQSVLEEDDINWKLKLLADWCF